MCLLLLGFPVTAEADAPRPAWDLVFRKDRRTVQVYATDGSSRVLLDEQELGWFRPFFGSVRFTADLDGDGLPEAVVGQFTGGAHCCYEYTVLRSRSNRVEPIQRFNLGNGRLEAALDLDRDRRHELVGWDDRLAYFGDLSFADSPLLPLVLCPTP